MQILVRGSYKKQQRNLTLLLKHEKRSTSASQRHLTPLPEKRTQIRSIRELLYRTIDDKAEDEHDGIASSVSYYPKQRSPLQRKCKSRVRPTSQRPKISCRLRNRYKFAVATCTADSEEAEESSTLSSQGTGIKKGMLWRNKVRFQSKGRAQHRSSRQCWR